MALTKPTIFLCSLSDATKPGGAPVLTDAQVAAMQPALQQQQDIEVPRYWRSLARWDVVATTRAALPALLAPAGIPDPFAMPMLFVDSLGPPFSTTAAGVHGQDLDNTTTVFSSWLPDALAYGGRPIGLVLTQYALPPSLGGGFFYPDPFLMTPTILGLFGSLAHVASHEACEMHADGQDATWTECPLFEICCEPDPLVFGGETIDGGPWVSRFAFREMCDPIGVNFYNSLGCDISDFTTEDWWNWREAVGLVTPSPARRYNFLNTLPAPFTLAPNGLLTLMSLGTTAHGPVLCPPVFEQFPNDCPPPRCAPVPGPLACGEQRIALPNLVSNGRFNGWFSSVTMGESVSLGAPGARRYGLNANHPELSGNLLSSFHPGKFPGQPRMNRRWRDFQPPAEAARRLTK